MIGPGIVEVQKFGSSEDQTKFAIIYVYDVIILIGHKHVVWVRPSYVKHDSNILADEVKMAWWLSWSGLSKMVLYVLSECLRLAYKMV